MFFVVTWKWSWLPNIDPHAPGAYAFDEDEVTTSVFPGLTPSGALVDEASAPRRPGTQPAETPTGSSDRRVEAVADDPAGLTALRAVAHAPHGGGNGVVVLPVARRERTRSDATRLRANGRPFARLRAAVQLQLRDGVRVPEVPVEIALDPADSDPVLSSDP